MHLTVAGGRTGSDEVVTWHDFTLGPGESRATSFVHPRSDPSLDGKPLVLPVRLSSRARTWRDLAGSLSHYRLVALGDHLVRRPRPGLEEGRSGPWCTVEELSRQCTGRHAQALRNALADVRIGADSPRETLLRLSFRDAGLPEPEINMPLVGPDGRTVHTPDFQWPAYRLTAEYDGGDHNQPDQVSRDIRRARRVREAGWTEVRLAASDTQHGCAHAVHLVREELQSKGWVP